MGAARTPETKMLSVVYDATTKFTEIPMIDSERRDRLRRISDHIDQYGYHVTTVIQDIAPRFTYTIGGSGLFGFELILAGSSIFLLEDVLKIIEHIVDCCKNGFPDDGKIEVDNYGHFTLRRAHTSWINILLLGAVDYFNDTTITAYQICPDTDHTTIDVPDLGLAWSAEREPAWRWLRQPWESPIPPTSTALTNLAALRGERITEASRWELDQWELFAGSGPDTPEHEVRIVPIGTLLAVDQTLEPVIFLDVGKSLWRDADATEWNEW